MTQRAIVDKDGFIVSVVFETLAEKKSEEK